MASVKFQKDSEEWLMFQDFYRLCQKYWIPEDANKNKTYWELLMAETGEFAEKYGQNDFAKRLALAFLGFQGGREIGK
jgi:hypothetical protein